MIETKEAKAHLEADVNKRRKVCLTKSMIVISCISPESRELLDRLCAKFKEEMGVETLEVNGYQTLYWACRYSGLIEAKKEDGE